MLNANTQRAIFESFLPPNFDVGQVSTALGHEGGLRGGNMWPVLLLMLLTYYLLL